MKLASPKKLTLYGAIAAASIAPVAAMGISSAATPSNPNIGSSSIPRITFKNDREQAREQVLGQSATAIKQAHENKSFKTMVKAKFPNGGYHKALNAQLTKELESQGYSQQDITIALQQKHINHLHHKEKKADASTKNS